MFFILIRYLLSVSQLSEIGFDCHFSDKGVSIVRREDSSIILTGRLSGRCRMDLPGPTTSVRTRTDYSVGPWDYPSCATRHLMA
jgi:hypothetical protein